VTDPRLQEDPIVYTSAHQISAAFMPTHIMVTLLQAPSLILPAINLIANVRGTSLGPC
jgi:hypothetical protein